MKKILFILILAMGSVYAKPCMTDIYFGNGVWNERDDAEDGMFALRKLMFRFPNSRLNRSLEDQEYNFKYAHNPTAGTIDDLIETFYQLKESGQISDGYFMGVYAALAAESNGEAFITKLRDIISTYNSDASSMFSLYQNSSFNQRHNVLLVAHSQGNLFGNKMFTLMSEAQKKKFRMVSVATPANHVAGGGPYVTASGDYVIGPIPGSLDANVIGFGHTFIGTYLNISGGGAFLDGSNMSPGLISSYVKSAYDSLAKSSTCGGYSQIYMRMYGVDYIKIYGVREGLNFGEEIGKVTFDKYDPQIKVIDEHERVYYYCSRPRNSYGTYPLFKGWSSSREYVTYLPGSMYSKETVEYRKGLSHTITSFNGKKCADVKFSGELYDIALSAFD